MPDKQVQMPLASENLEFGAQLAAGVKVALGVAAVVAVVVAVATFMVWASPFWAAYFSGKH
jgi:hypothetical protein